MISLDFISSPLGPFGAKSRNWIYLTSSCIFILPGYFFSSLCSFSSSTSLLFVYFLGSLFKFTGVEEDAPSSAP